VCIQVGDDRDHEVLNKVGQAIGHLQALEKLRISTCSNRAGESYDWEILVPILRHVRQKIALQIDRFRRLKPEDSILLARAIHGHPMITSFEHDEHFPYECLDSLYSAVATLPALESISLCGCNQRTTPEDESALSHPESLTALLQVPSLQSVYFENFKFTPALCQATANALMEGTAITKLEFAECSFSAEGSAVMMANGLSRNTSVSHVKVESSRDQALFGVLATALPSNSTLRRLDLRWQDGDGDDDFAPVLLASAKNTGLRHLSLGADR
jgi:hypothetical protein